MADVSPGGTPSPDPSTLAPAPAGPVAPVPSDAAYAAAARRTGWRRWLPIAGVVSFLLAGAIGMLLFLGVNIGLTGLIVGLVAAVIPVPLLVASFLWLDRYEPEPIRYLAFCFAWGAAIATAVALGVNTGASILFDKWGLPEALVAVLVAPFIEELMKAAGPLLLFWRRRAEWSGITDGIVYCGLSALGFAMVENVLYLGEHGYATGVEQFGPATGLQNLFAIFIVRILFTGFAHPLFSSMTGIGLGIAARSGDRRVRWLAPIAGLLLAMILHGTFNLLPTLSLSLGQPLIMLYGYLGFMVPLFFAVVGFAIALRSWEGRLTERILPFYVNTGWFSPPEVAALGSLGRRYSARQWARRVAGDSGQKAMRSFQFASTQLALLRDGMNRGLDRKPQDVDRAAAQEQRLLNEILGYRAVFTARDPQAPQAFWDGRNYQIAFPDGVTRTVPPPAEPVVPLPIVINQPAYAFAAPGFGPPGTALPGYGPQSAMPGYGPQGGALSGYGPQSAMPGYGPQGGAPGYPGFPQGGPPASGAPGYGPSPSYGLPPSYGQQPSYAPQPGYVRPPAPEYGAQSGHSPQPGFAQPGFAQPGFAQPGFAQPGYGAQPGYAPEPGQATQSGYVAPPSQATQPGYVAPPSQATQPGYVAPPSQATQPGYVAPPGQATQPGYVAPPGYATQPGYAPEPGHATQPLDSGDPVVGAQPESGAHPGVGAQPESGAQPGVGAHPGVGAQPTIGDQPAYTHPPLPGHPTPPAFAPVPTDPAAETTSEARPANDNPPAQR